MPHGAIRQQRHIEPIKGSLLERLRTDDLDRNPDHFDAVSARIASIKVNLVHVLNSRSGHSPSCPDFGLEDFNDATVGSANMLRIVAEDIQRVIRSYEPRITNVSVSFDRQQAGGIELFFQISAQTFIGNAREQVTIDLVLLGGRSFRVR